jgi:hypothetical protein
MIDSLYNKINPFIKNDTDEKRSIQEKMEEKRSLKSNKTDVLCDHKNNNDISNFLEYDVENPEFLEIINGERAYSDIICWNSILQYMTEKNEKFCAEHCLCEICRSELKEYVERIDGIISDMYWSCENGC